MEGNLEIGIASPERTLLIGTNILNGPYSASSLNDGGDYVPKSLASLIEQHKATLKGAKFTNLTDEQISRKQRELEAKLKKEFDGIMNEDESGNLKKQVLDNFFSPKAYNQMFSPMTVSPAMPNPSSNLTASEAKRMALSPYDPMSPAPSPHSSNSRSMQGSSLKDEFSSESAAQSHENMSPTATASALSNLNLGDESRKEITLPVTTLNLSPFWTKTKTEPNEVMVSTEPKLKLVSPKNKSTLIVQLTETRHATDHHSSDLLQEQRDDVDPAEDEMSNASQERADTKEVVDDDDFLPEEAEEVEHDNICCVKSDDEAMAWLRAEMEDSDDDEMAFLPNNEPPSTRSAPGNAPNVPRNPPVRGRHVRSKSLSRTNPIDVLNQTVSVPKKKPTSTIRSLSAPRQLMTKPLTSNISKEMQRRQQPGFQRGRLTMPRPFHFNQSRMHTVETPKKGEHQSLAESQETFFHKGLRDGSLTPTSRTKKTRVLTTPKPFSFHDSQTASSAQKETVLTLGESMNQFIHKGLGNNESQRKSKSSEERNQETKLTQPIPFNFCISKNPRQGEYAEAKKNDMTMGEHLEHFSSNLTRYDSGNKTSSSHDRNTHQRPKLTQPVPFNFSVPNETRTGEYANKKDNYKGLAESMELFIRKGLRDESEKKPPTPKGNTTAKLTEPVPFNFAMSHKPAVKPALRSDHKDAHKSLAVSLENFIKKGLREDAQPVIVKKATTAPVPTAPVPFQLSMSRKPKEEDAKASHTSLAESLQTFITKGLREKTEQPRPSSRCRPHLTEVKPFQLHETKLTVSDHTRDVPTMAEKLNTYMNKRFRESDRPTSQRKTHQGPTKTNPPKLSESNIKRALHKSSDDLALEYRQAHQFKARPILGDTHRASRTNASRTSVSNRSISSASKRSTSSKSIGVPKRSSSTRSVGSRLKSNAVRRVKTGASKNKSKQVQGVAPSGKTNTKVLYARPRRRQMHPMIPDEVELQRSTSADQDSGSIISLSASESSLTDGGDVNLFC
eukprot:CAMPEP_0198280810 /NCGR_PEP_ID=MMETSP1449-20131203/830_1 /TAXON_ID=420275 /ORGANISM="Attheya septentrionalis, Strain CCMP2084" /LENGTH=1011 /DNA_ID=CAMNT_0043976313 /DNA_START=198 /DNA_END=3233 /DNA_ORIENTATION=-